MSKPRPLIVPATEKGIRTLANLLARFIPHVTMTGAQVMSLDPLMIREDGDTEDSPCQDVVGVPALNRQGVVLRQGSRRVLHILN